MLHKTSRRSPRRTVQFLLFACIAVFLYYIVLPRVKLERHEDVEYGLRLSDYARSSNWSTYEATQRCRFPILDPFDPSITKFVSHPPPLKCKFVQPSFTKATLNEVILDRGLAHKYKLHRIKYRVFRRANGSDSSIFYDEWSSFPLDQPVKLRGNGIVVSGRYNGTMTYSNIHASVVPVYRKTASKANDSFFQPSVLILGIDSLSGSNFIRNLPKTYSNLTNGIGGWDFRGYSKVDDNTYPNMLAVLTGQKVTVRQSELDGNPQTEFVDSWPFVWKNFSAAGYTTFLAEEQPGIFSYKGAGFRRPPTDVYLRPYGQILNEDQTVTYRSSRYCYGNEPESALVLNNIERFLELQRQSGTPFFALSFLWKVSHDLANSVEILDTLLSDWLSRIHQAGLLRDVMLFVMADHGNRFDKIRSTLVGRYEERMPFLFVRPPERLLKSQPTMQETLTKNLWRMTCQYDVYETLVDVVNNRYGENRSTLYNRGRSLFTPIPLERTCDDVDIDEHFCVCQEETQLSTDTSIVKQAAQTVMDAINRSLQPVAELCLPVSLDFVKSAERMSANKKVQNNNRWHYTQFIGDANVTDIISFVRVTLSAKPNQAVFEAVVQVTQKSLASSEIKLHTDLGRISRINSYGQSASCISLTHRPLEKICTCKEFAI